MKISKMIQTVFFSLFVLNLFLDGTSVLASSGSGALEDIEKFCQSRLDPTSTDVVRSTPAQNEVKPERVPDLVKAAELLTNLPATVSNGEAHTALTRLGQTLFRNTGSNIPKDPMLSDVSLKELSGFSQDGAALAETLITLAKDMTQYHKQASSFSSRGVKLLSRIPFFGTSIESYFVGMQSANTKLLETQKVIEGLREKVGKSVLFFQKDAKIYQAQVLEIQEQIAELKFVKDNIERNLSPYPTNHPQRRQIEQVVLFPMSQRISDLAQKVATLQQGYLASEVLVRTGLERIRRADSAIEVALPALQVATKLEAGMGQQAQLDGAVDRVAEVTNLMMQKTATRLEEHARKTREDSVNGLISLETLGVISNSMRKISTEEEQFRATQLPLIDAAMNRYLQVVGELNEIIETMDQQNSFMPIASGTQKRLK